MKIPRNINGNKLVKLLKKYDYDVTRQTGSHIRLTTNLKGTHHITVPAHNPIKIGTLSSILKDIANHLQISKDELINEIF